MRYLYCADVKCPFFTCETEKSLSCQGVKKGIVNTMRFPNCAMKYEYMEKNCIHFPNDCPVFKAAWESGYEKS